MGAGTGENRHYAAVSGQTKSDELRAFLKRRIVSGDYPPGSKIDAERTLTERFGVSRATVNKVLSILVAEGLLVRVAGRGTFVAEDIGTADAADGAAHTRQIVFAFYEPISQLAYGYFYSRVLEAACGAASARGYRMILEHAPATERLLDSSPRVAGLLGVGVEDDRMIAAWRDARMPVVLCDYEDPAGECDSVVFDNEAAGRMVGEYLLSRRHTRIGLVNELRHPERATQAAELREAGLRSALAEAEAGLAEADVLRTGIRPTYNVPEIREFLSRDGRPAAVAVFGDHLARSVARGMSELGLSCPEDVALASMGLSDEPIDGLPRMTGARFPVSALGKLAVERLIERIEAPQTEPKRLRLPPDLVEGESA